MPATIRRYRAACVQAEPGWFNLEKSVQKTVDLIREAGDKQCKLIGFPEACECCRWPSPASQPRAHRDGRAAQGSQGERDGPPLRGRHAAR